ncbi:MAG: hypothetical protein IH840_03755 [Candidatus Heimdallarchaeota archaeon]|nr:hypothetical protein [Candidatus Heimdallarchaeota archaeon]
MNRKKYVSPEFYTDDGSVDVDKSSSLIQADKERRSKEREEFKKTLEEMKLIKRKSKSKKEKVDKKVKPKTAPKTEAPPGEETRSRSKSN